MEDIAPSCNARDPTKLALQELHRDLLFGRGFRVLRGLPVPPAVSFKCASCLLCA